MARYRYFIDVRGRVDVQTSPSLDRSREFPGSVRGRRRSARLRAGDSEEGGGGPSSARLRRVAAGEHRSRARDVLLRAAQSGGERRSRLPVLIVPQ